MVKLTLASMAKRGVAKIMGQCEGLCEILVQPKSPGDGAGHLGNLNRVCQPCAVVIALMIEELLWLVIQAAEGCGMDDPVPVALKRSAPVGLVFRYQPAPGLGGDFGIWHQLSAHRPSGLTSSIPVPT